MSAHNCLQIGKQQVAAFSMNTGNKVCIILVLQIPDEMNRPVNTAFMQPKPVVVISILRPFLASEK